MSTKVTELTSLGSAPADTDVIPVVDVSDTSQAASGTLKKLAASYLAKTDGTAATITGGGTVALGGYTLTVGATGTASLDGHAHAASAITSGTFDDARVAASNVTQHQEALSITESQISDLGSYLTTVAVNELSDVTIDTVADNEVLAYDSTSGNWINQTAAEAGLAAASHNQDASTITSGTLDDARVAVSNVTQHQASLSITESQISDLGSYEAALGNPGTDNYVLSSLTDGTRSWVAQSGGAAETRFTIATQLDSTVTTTSYTAYAFTSSFAITADMIPSGKSVYFAAIMKAASGETVYAELSGVTGSEISTTTTSYTYVVSASAITLTPGTVYYVQLKSSGGSSSNSVGSAYIVFK